MLDEPLNLALPPRNWLCIITSDREYANVEEMTRDTWQHFDGIFAVVHSQAGDPALAGRLEERCKGGGVTTRDFSWHHAHSMNEWLFDKRIRPMDACWIRDSSERFNPAFTKDIAALSASLLSNNIWNLAQHSKLLMFRRWFNQQFVNGLHWGLSGLYGPTVAIEQLMPRLGERDSAYSVRNEKRPFDHRYRHECLYLLDYGLNGNHLQLFHPNAAELDRAQWELFHFMQFLTKERVYGVDGLTSYLQMRHAAGTPLTEDLKRWLNNERPFRNLYRYLVLGHKHEDILLDEDTWRIS